MATITWKKTPTAKPVASDPPKPPPALDAIVDRVLAYRPKDAKPAKRCPDGVAEDTPVYTPRRKRPPNDG